MRFEVRVRFHRIGDQAVLLSLFQNSVGLLFIAVSRNRQTRPDLETRELGQLIDLVEFTFGVAA